MSINPNVDKEWSEVVWAPLLLPALVEVDDEVGLIVVCGVVCGVVAVGEADWRSFFAANPTLNANDPFADLAAANCLKTKRKH